MALLALVLGAPALGCGDAEPEPDTMESPSEWHRRPFRDEWRVEADLPFVHTDGSGTVLIGDLSIGGASFDDNFANRGDVIVRFDGPADRILIEMRRFTHTTTQQLAQEDFDDLSLWAFDAPLGRPQDLGEEDSCLATGWRSGCQIRVYYDGQKQLVRSGADLRITLPPDYRQRIDVQTEDDIADDDYFNRGDVCIQGLPGSATVTTDSGNVWVSLARTITPTPTCSADAIARCEGWVTEDGASAPWDPACGCTAHGSVDVSNRAGASNITVDLPPDLWASIRAENAGSNTTSGEYCEATIDVPGLQLDPIGNDFPWQAAGAANYPGEPAIGGAGYFVKVESSECGPVAHTDDPDDFVGVGNGDEQESEERGNIEVCAGCITLGCDELVP